MTNKKLKAKTQGAAIKNKNWLVSAAASLIVLLLVILPVFALGAESAKADNPLTTWWTPPQPLLSYSRDVKLAYDPIANSVSYATDSEAYGVATGSEFNDWLSMNYLKLSTDTPNIDQWPDTTFDQFGTQYIVWGGRNTQTANMNLKFNKLTKGTNNVGIERNLTLELFGSDKYTGAPKIAYSVQQNKLFMVFYQRGDGSAPGSGDENDNNDSPVFFTESADQGTTWSKPLQIGLLQGYSPALPSILVDAQGNPHVFFGQMSTSGGKSWLYTTVRYGSNAWTQPQEITNGNRTRLFRPQEVLAPDGDIWLTMVTDPASGISANKEVEVLRENGQNGQWSQFLDVSQNHPGAGYSTIAVDENNKVWVIWTNTFGDTSIWSTLSTYTTDNGQTWHAVTQVLRNSDWNWKRSFVLSAVYAKKAIYLVTSGEWTDPNYTNGPTLFLQTIPDVANLDGPEPTAIPTIPTTPATAADTSGSNTPTPTLANTPMSNSTTTSPTSSLTPTPANASNRQATVTPASTPTVANITTTTVVAATHTPTPSPTATPTNTTIVAIVPPTSTNTPYPANAESGSGEAGVIQQPQQSTQAAVTATTRTSTPTAVKPSATPSLAPQNATANAYAATQAIAALTPQIVQLPSSNSGVAAAVNGNNSSAWGLGPQVVLPTATATPRPTVTPTPLPTPTAANRIVGSSASSANGKGNAASAITPAVTIIVVTATPNPNQQPQQQSGETQIQQQSEPQKVPPPLGAIWLLPVAVVVGAKGVLNIMTARAVAKAGIKAIGKH